MFPSAGARCVFAVLVLTGLCPSECSLGCSLGCAPQSADIEGLALLSAAKGLAAIVLSWGDRPIDGLSTTELLGVINQVGSQAYSAILDEPSVAFLVLCCCVLFCSVPCSEASSLTH